MTSSPVAVLGFELLRADLVPALFAAPALVILLVRAGLLRRRDRARVVDPHLEAQLYRDFAPGRSRARGALAVAAISFFVLALLGPVRGFTLREAERRGLDLVICLDTSRSMMVTDLSRDDRLVHAKREIELLLRRLEGDRVALIGFSGDVRKVAPLTRDVSTARWFLESMQPEDNVKGGTDIGLALEGALELFDGRSGAHEAIILLTDGEDLEQQSLEVAQAAAVRGIRVFVVGMGTPAGGKVPDPRRGGFVRGPDGSEVVSKLDGESLMQIAEVTGGAYVSAQTPLALEKLYEREIQTMEGRTITRGKERIPHDRYQWPLVLALLFMLLEAGLAEREASGRGGRRRA